jgi:hypothetical protein
MAITATAVLNNGNAYKSWNVVCSDTDTTGSFAHGFGVTPDLVAITQLFSLTTADNPDWAATWTATTITLLKQSATGSGGTTSGTTVVVKVFAMLPHSILQA